MLRSWPFLDIKWICAGLPPAPQRFGSDSIHSLNFSPIKPVYAPIATRFVCNIGFCLPINLRRFFCDSVLQALGLPRRLHTYSLRQESGAQDAVEKFRIVFSLRADLHARPCGISHRGLRRGMV